MMMTIAALLLAGAPWVIPPPPGVGADGVATADLDMNDNAILNPLEGIYGEAPTADTDPDDILIHAEHSYSQGTQTAANLVLAGGLGDGYVFQSTDWANSTDDTLTIIVGHCAVGVCATLGTVTLTESIHWDCDVTSDAVCACALYTYLAANLPTGIASVSRTDGTCSDAKVFLQPEDEGTYSLVLATQDAGGGGVWGTAGNGADGSVAIHTGYNALVVTPTLIGIGGTTASHPALKGLGVTGLETRKADNSGRTDLHTANLTANSNITAGSAGAFSHSGRTKWVSSADGIWKMGINAGTQEVRFDAASTANWVYLTDESGNNLTLAVHTLGNINGGMYSAGGRPLSLRSGNSSAGAATGAISLTTGNQTNVGDYPSGDVIACQTGDTTTDGNSGSCYYTTGVAGAGQVDGGDHVWKVHGTIEAMKITGADGEITFPAGYTRSITTEAGAAMVGAVAPNSNNIVDSGGVTVARALGFDSTAGEEALFSQCVPLDWEGASNWTLRVVWHNTNGDVIQNTEDIDFYARVRTVASGESTETAAVTSYTATYIGGAAETDGERYDTDITITYNDVTNPLTAGDCVYINFQRNVGATEVNSYSGDANITKWILRFTSTGLSRN